MKFNKGIVNIILDFSGNTTDMCRSEPYYTMLLLKTTMQYKRSKTHSGIHFDFKKIYQLSQITNNIEIIKTKPVTVSTHQASYSALKKCMIIYVYEYDAYCPMK